MSAELASARKCLENGQLDRAATLLDAILRSSPKDADALVLRAVVCATQAEPDDAVRWLRKALNAAPNRWDIQHDAGLAYLGMGRADEALRRFEVAASLNPNSAEIPVQIGRVYLDRLKQPAAAADAFRRAIRMDPGQLDAIYHLGKALFQLGEIDLAVSLLRDCWELAELAEKSEISVLCLQAIAVAIPGAMSADNAAILAARRKWTRTLESVPRTVATFRDRDRTPDRPLTIGYISSFFDSENWMKPVWGLINQHDREQFRVRIFSFGPVPGGDGTGAATTAFRPHDSDRIFDVANLDHERTAALIADEQVDVLIDLNGYSDPQRLNLLLMRPAPVIVGWFNMYATTALSCFDYLIGDRHVVLPEEERHYSERIVRVPGSYLTFDVGYPVPEVSPPPCLATGEITFGSLCSRYKFTPEVIGAWSEILKRCPKSRLVLRNGGLEQPPEREHLHRQFAAHGINPERVQLLGRAPHFEFLETYAQFDIALDTFPYNGGTTTTEAIWQGVPVVTDAGRTWASRTSATLLREGGLGDWVANDLQGYVELAARWGNDPDAPRRLAELRTNMRERLRASSVCDTAAFARAMESLYRAMWRKWSGEKSLSQ